MMAFSVTRKHRQQARLSIEPIQMDRNHCRDHQECRYEDRRLVAEAVQEPRGQRRADHGAEAASAGASISGPICFTVKPTSTRYAMYKLEISPPPNETSITSGRMMRVSGRRKQFDQAGTARRGRGGVVLAAAAVVRDG